MWFNWVTRNNVHTQIKFELWAVPALWRWHSNSYRPFCTETLVGFCHHCLCSFNIFYKILWMWLGCGSTLKLFPQNVITLELIMSQPWTNETITEMQYNTKIPFPKLLFGKFPFPFIWSISFFHFTHDTYRTTCLKLFYLLKSIDLD